MTLQISSVIVTIFVVLFSALSSFFKKKQCRYISTSIDGNLF